MDQEFREGLSIEGRYEIIERLGAGGMATAYLATDHRLDCPVVVKFPHAHMLETSGFRARFEREIRRLVQFRHAHVVGVLDAGEHEDVPYVVMEYLEGGSLANLLDKGRQSPGEVVPWLRAVAMALDYIHADGSVHRDVKPGNILFDRGGVAYLADFGLVKTLTKAETVLTAEGVAPGSLAYMSMEAFLGAAGPENDQYGLACSVLHALTGELPRPLEARQGIEEHHLPELPRDARAALLRALAPGAGERYRSCGEFAEAFAAGLVPSTRPEGESPPEAQPEPTSSLPAALARAWAEAIVKAASTSGVDRHAAFHRIPWFVVLGGPETGKSEMLAESGLELSIAESGDGEVRGRWWVGRCGVFFETAVSDPTDVEWQAFFGVLEEHRRGRRVDAVIATVAVSTLLEKGARGAELEGERLGAFAQDLAKKGPGAPPLFLVATRCDQLAGFTRFFGALPRKYQNQSFGWSELDDGGPDFDARFDGILKRLVDVRPCCISRAEPDDHLAVFLFPAEFEYLRVPLKACREALVRAAPMQLPLSMAGVYFIGQPGGQTVFAPAFSRFAETFSLPSPQPDATRVSTDSSGFFSRDLFERVLRSEVGGPASRSGVSARWLSRRSRGWWLAGVGLATCLALLISRAFVENRSRLSVFQVSIPEGARPLETAIGCLKTRDESVKPGFLDLGLNPSDELMPSLNASFRSVFSRGCLSPLLADIAKAIRAGIPEDENGRPDVPAYLANWQRYVFLRDDLPARPDPQEEPVLESLFTMLRARAATGHGTRSDLRYALREYGGLGGDAEFRARRRELESAFILALTPLVENSEEWVDGHLRTGAGFEQALLDAIDGLKAECLRCRSKIAPHESENDIAAFALAIRRSAEVLVRTGPSGQSLEMFAGVTESADLAKLLRAVKAAYPKEGEIAADSTPKGGHLPRRIDQVIGKLDEPLAQESLRGMAQARMHLVGFLDSVIEGDDRTFAYESPTRASLLGRRTEIDAEIALAEAEAWSRVKAAVAEIEGGPVEEEDGDGNLRPREGWWQTLPMLVKARLTDARKAEYLRRGLTVYLSDDRWHLKRLADREDEVYTRTRLEELVLPAMREQIGFFDDEYAAASLCGDARRVATAGVTGYLDKLGEYWTGRFENAVTESVGESLTEIYEQLREWEDGRSDLRRACTEIEKALYDLTDIVGTEDDPLLESSFEARRSIFENFVVCFDPREGKVSRHATVIDASARIAAVSRLLEPVVGRTFGGVDRAAARRLVGQILTGSGPSSAPLTEAMQLSRDFKRESNSRPAQILAKWLERAIGIVWERLVELAAEDINQRWSSLANEWRSTLSGGDLHAFSRIFGARASEFVEFEREYIDPFFRLPGREPVAVAGATLVLRDELRRFLVDLTLYQGALFTETGGIRSDSLEVSLKIAGTAPSGLRLRYQSDSGTLSSEERRPDHVPTKFRWSWTPLTCESFAMEVFFRDDSSKRLPRAFVGSWAVAEALAAADRQSGNTFTWRGEEKELGTWEIELTFQGDGPGNLYMLYKQVGGRNPVESLLASLPDAVVEVWKQRK